MRYVRLGDSGLRVSPFIVGCTSFGDKRWASWVKEAHEALPLLKAAINAGINIWDTVGEDAIGTHEPTTLANLPSYINRNGLSRTALFKQVDTSLKRLQTLYIDLLQIQRLDDTSFIEIMKASHDLVESGKVRYIGASSTWAHEFAQLQGIAEAKGWTKVISMQNERNLFYREEAGDSLARPYPGSSAQSDRGSQTKSTLTPADIETINRLESVAQRRGWTMAQTAFAWTMSKTMALILGISSEARLKEFVDAVDFELSAEEQTYLEITYQPKATQGFNMDQVSS